MTFNELFIQINIDLISKYGEFYNILFSNYLLTQKASIRYNLSVYELQQIIEFIFNTYYFEIQLYNELYKNINDFINLENYKDNNSITRLNEVLIGKITSKFNENKNISNNKNSSSNSDNINFAGMTEINLNNFSNLDKTTFSDTNTDTETQVITGNADDNFNEVDSTGNKIQDTENALNVNLGNIYFSWLNARFESPRRNIMKQLDDLKISIVSI